MTKNTFIIATDIALLPELVTGAQAFGGSSTIAVFGDEAAAEAASYGANRVIEFPRDGFIEGYAPAIAKEVDGIVLADGTVQGRLISGLVAGALGSAVFANVRDIAVEGDDIVLSQMAYGGAGIKTVRVVAENPVITVPNGLFAKAETSTESTPIEKMDAACEAKGIVMREVRPKGGETINLAAAKIVVGIGRGFTVEEDLQLAYNLADAIGAEIACSRPITEGQEWLPRERYIGVSGVMLKPDVYVALGISGQVQHMVGVNQAKTIFAVNKDKNAPIFKQVDVGVVGDLRTVVPALTAQLQAR